MQALLRSFQPPPRQSRWRMKANELRPRATCHWKRFARRVGAATATGLYPGPCATISPQPGLRPQSWQRGSCSEDIREQPGIVDFLVALLTAKRSSVVFFERRVRRDIRFGLQAARAEPTHMGQLGTGMPPDRDQLCRDCHGNLFRSHRPNVDSDGGVNALEKMCGQSFFL